MSKSLGNFYTLRDIIQRGYSGREIRYALLSAQYRQPLNFTFPALDAARSSLQRLDEFIARLFSVAEHEEAAGVLAARRENPEWIERFMQKFRAAMDEDLNMPVALSTVFDLAHEGNRKMAAGPLPAAEASAARKALDEIDSVLGVLKHDDDKPESFIVELAQKRQNARMLKNWAEADRFRKEIEAKGWLVQDAADGYKLKKRHA